MEKNFAHPKYTLETSPKGFMPFVIVEHIAVSTGGPSDYSLQDVRSRSFMYYDNLQDAIIALAALSTGPVTIAWSHQPIDNAFDVSKD